MNSLILAILLLAGQAGEFFNDSRIVSSFAVISDVHINGRKDATAKFHTALEQLKAEALKDDADGLDAVLVAGDLIDWAYNNPKHVAQIDCFKRDYEACLDPLRVPMIYTPGNHDLYKQWTPNSFKEAAKLRVRLGDNYFRTDIDNESREAMECRHCVVKGVHILTMLPVGYSPVVYDPRALDWLSYTLKSITTAEPDAFVLILTHPMTYNTVYGSDLGEYWYSAQLNPILENFPQAVVFGGHLHFALNDPRSIWQGAFTSVGTASVSYMSVEDGGFEDMKSQFEMKDCYQFSQGLLLQFDSEGNMRIRRMDFHNSAVIGEDWVLPHPAADGHFAKPYDHEALAAANRAPKLSKAAVEKRDSNYVLRFQAAKDDCFAHHYVISLSTRDSLVFEKRLLADFYKVPSPSMMKKDWELDLGVLPEGRYKINLVAVDSWGRNSNKICRRFRVAKD